MSSLTRLREGTAAKTWKLLRKLHGDSPLQYADELERRQWMGHGELRRWQFEQLLETVQIAHDRVPFYRRRLAEAFGGRPTGPLDEEHFARIPILTKDDVRQLGRQLLARDERGLRCGCTSGSTGVPVQVWLEPSYMGYVWAVQRRALNWYGVEPWERTFYFGGPAQSLRDRCRQRVVDVAIDRLIRPAYDLSPAALDRILRRLRRFRPHVVTGYSSAIYQLALHAQESGRRMNDLGVRLVVPCSEQVQDYYEQTLSQVFGAPVMQEYGCVEVNALAYKCPQGRMHVSHEHVYLELLDEHGHAVPDGEPGCVTLTPLRGRAMPLVRYQLGDLATIDSTPCPCGRHPGLPTIRSLMGRQMDHIVDRNGGRWHSLVFFYTFKSCFDTTVFKEFQGSQSAPGKVHLRIVPGARFTPAEGDRFTRLVSEAMHGSVDISWEAVDRIEREGSGKLRYFKCDLANGKASLSRPLATPAPRGTE